LNKITEILLSHGEDIVKQDSNEQRQLVPSKQCLDDVWTATYADKGLEVVYEALKGDTKFATALSKAAMDKTIDSASDVVGLALFHFRRVAYHAIGSCEDDFWKERRQSRQGL
jgi:hypothetical protein